MQNGAREGPVRVSGDVDPAAVTGPQGDFGAHVVTRGQRERRLALVRGRVEVVAIPLAGALPASENVVAGRDFASQRRLVRVELFLEDLRSVRIFEPDIAERALHVEAAGHVHDLLEAERRGTRR